MSDRSIFTHAMVLAALLCLPAWAQAYDGEFMLFPTVTGLHRNSLMVEHPQDEIDPSVDAFYSASHGQLRFLAEYYAAPSHHMMERLKIGWATPHSTVWLGRFHNPLGYWNTAFHHGNYLATTITRPGIVAFEEHGGGVLPMHLSGLLLEGSIDSPMSYSLSLGVGPTLGMMGLMPVDMLDPTEHHGGLAASGRVTYRPTNGSPDEFGVFAARTRIPGNNLSMPMQMGGMIMSHPVNAITQTLIGAEMNQEFDQLRLMGELYIVRNRVEIQNGTKNNTFASGYLQADFSIMQDWTLFGRIEDTADANGDFYLDLHHDFIKSRNLAGVRYALSNRQALKFEISRSELQNKSKFSLVGIEWSAVFP